MHKHAKNCWGDENVSKPLKAKGSLSIDEVHKSLAHAELKDQSWLPLRGKGKVMLHSQHVAITVHLEYQGEPLSMLLDIVEVAKSHTGVNLAAAFAKILEEYGITDKVIISLKYRIILLICTY